MKSLCIVIPIYNETPTASEVLSLQSLANKCPGKYDICFIHPESFTEETLEKYDSIIRNVDTNRQGIKYLSFIDHFFKSTVEYSSLMKTAQLYKSFDNYDYILIFQTDCWAIDMSTLDNWMEQDFDYVGPPIITNKKLWTSSPCCGNGGLSLRKVSSFIKYTSDVMMRKDIEKQNDKYILYEDLYFCDGVSQYLNVDMPTWEDCAEFGFDMNPDILDKDGYDWTKLVGCHAWGKNMPYWKDKFKISNDIAKEEYEKHKMFIDIYYKKELL